MTVSYVTYSQVQQWLRSTYVPNSTDQTTFDTQIIPGACAWLDNYCNRANGGFAVQTYDELYNGTGVHHIFLNNTPIQSIARIATTQLPALYIQNQDSDMGARATVQIIGNPANPYNLSTQYTSTGVVLTYVKNAVTTTNTLLWSQYPTVNALVAAINTLGNFWNAGVQGGFGTWSTTDLRATQGAFGARITTCYLWIHWYDLPWYRVENENNGEITSTMGFTRGSANWRIIYSAGYTIFPDDLTQAVCEICANTYYARELNSNTTSETLGPTSYTQFSTKGFEGLSIQSRNTLNRYKIRAHESSQGGEICLA